MYIYTVHIQYMYNMTPTHGELLPWTAPDGGSVCGKDLSISKLVVKNRKWKSGSGGKTVPWLEPTTQDHPFIL